MAKAGDRIELPGRKVGQARRTGVVEDVHGSLLTVQWDTGERTTFTPAAGALQVLAPRPRRKAR
ncbi:MAG TPA: DUF1918 domain-containing protein [Acidimicrobiales bacterium]